MTWHRQAILVLSANLGGGIDMYLEMTIPDLVLWFDDFVSLKQKEIL